MDDSWRFRSIQSNICPTCSISHFPFCPPPPAFDRNGYPGENLRGYPPDIDPPFRRPLQDPPFNRPLHDPSFHRPLHDPQFHRPLHDPQFHRPLHDPPFPDHRQLPPPVPLPMPVVKGPEPWSSNLLRPDWHPSPQFFHEEFLERESFRKRMRVEEPALGNFPPPQPYNRYDLPPSRNLLDDERMLNLIRDHGQHNTTVYEADSRYQDRIIGMDRGFYDPGLGSTARNGPVLPPEPPFSHQNGPLQASSYEVYQNFPIGPSSQSSDRFLPHERRDFQRGEFDINKSGVFNSQIGEDPYGRKGQYDPSLQLPHRYRHGDSIENSENYEFRAAVERPFYDSYPQFSSTTSAPVERPLYDSYPQVSSTASDYASRGPYEKYYGHDPQQLHLNESSSSILPNQPQYPHNDSSQLPSNVVIHERESAHPFHAARHPIESKFEPHGQHVEAMRTPLELKPPVHEDIYKPPVHENIYSPFDSQRYPLVEQSGGPSISKHGGYIMSSSMLGQMHNPQTYPPLPPQPLPAVHDEPPASNFQVTSSTSAAPPVLNHAPASTSVIKSLPPSTSNFAEPQLLPQIDFYKEPHMHDSSGLTNEGLPFINQTSLKQYPEGGQTFPLKHSLKDKPTIIDASHLFKHPNRTSRPEYIVIILRGLPGSGKSYMAKAIRDIEVENGGNVPRIHAIDDYFMIEVEKKVEDNDGSKSSSSFRGKKQITKKVVEYCYEREMEEAYRSSMLKAFKKTLEEGVFTFIIVDDRNLRVADFAQFWAIAKRSGYEVYLLEAAYKDPAGCAARNVHGFTFDDIQKMAEQWEEAPSLYHQLDIQSLFHGDDLNEHSIEEVDMDTDDTVCDEEDMSQLQGGEVLKMTGSESVDHSLDVGLVKVGDRWDSEEDEELTEVKELKRSKWSRDLDEDIESPNGAKENLNALSGLIQAYGKGEKSVHWGDRVDNGGFSIGAVKKKSIISLVIGPGSGYNLNSNPLLEEANDVDGSGISSIGDSKRRFHEQLRAERESFKAVFDRRRHRIGGLFNTEDES